MPRESFPAALIATRGNRCTATIMGFLEDTLYEKYPNITTEDQRRLRNVVVGAVNAFKDLAIDIVKSDQDLINDIWVQKLDEIHTEMQKLNAS